MKIESYHDTEYGTDSRSIGLVRNSGEVFIYLWFDRREVGLRIGRIRLALQFAYMAD